MTTRVLFICLGNICRSPTAEGVFRRLVRDAGLEHSIEVDSAGTGAYHVGHPPDRRATAAARARGVELSGLRARKVTERDFDEFDYIVAMDQENLRDLSSRCPKRLRERLSLLLEHAERGTAAREVPDPYYGGDRGFEEVLDLVDAGARGLLARIRRDHGL